MADKKSHTNGDGKFFALLNRMKYINRWGLMKNLREESVALHSIETAFIAHALALIGNEYLGKTHDPDRVAAAALYHDATEILTGDMPSPIKYMNAGIKQAYKDIEKNAAGALAARLPPELARHYASYLGGLPEDAEVSGLIHAADKLCAYIKCTDELNAGNKEYELAARSIKKILDAMAATLPELDYFMTRFLPAFSLTLDEYGGE